MEHSSVQRWLKRRITRDAAGNVFLALLALAAGAVVLTITFFFTYPIVWFGINLGVSGLSRLLFNLPLHVAFPTILLVCWLTLVLLFVGNATTNREDLANLPKRNYTAYPSGAGLLGALGFLLAYPGASSRLIVDILFTGPRLVVAAWNATKKACRLLRMDADGCARVLAVLPSRNGHFSLDELMEWSGLADGSRVFQQLRDIDGVVFLHSEPAGMSLTAELRQELRAITATAPRRVTVPDSDAGGPTICEVLGVSPGASLEEIEAAYDRWIHQAPPDRSGASDRERAKQLEEQVRVVNAAYEAFLAQQRPQATPEPTPEEKGNVEGLWRRYRRPQE